MKGKSALGHSSETKISPKPPKSIWIIVAIWLLAIGSLLGTHYFLNHKPRPDRARITKMEAKLKSLTDDQKIRLKYFEGGLLESASGDFLLIDSSMEKSDLEQRGLP